MAADRSGGHRERRAIHIVNQLGLHLLYPATPPNAAIASDTSNTTSPVLGGGGKPLCPPVNSPVRVDTVITNGAGQVGVQVWVK